MTPQTPTDDPPADNPSAGKTPLANRRTDQSLEPAGGAPGQDSRLHAATRIQSPVRPEDYPAADIAAQLDAAGVRPERQRRSDA